MRTLNELSKETQGRLRDYIARWPTLTSKQLAEDLSLKPTTVAAVKANITRKRDREFNKALAR
jgi:FixJ family two-component response regulator